jgi:hypothetical protein
MRTTTDTLSNVATAVSRRLTEMGQVATSVAEAELPQRFARETAVSGLHYQIELSGTPCLYSVWVVSGAKSAEGDILNGELVALEKSRIVWGAITVVENLFLLTETLAAVGASDSSLPFVIRKFNETFWDEATLKHLYGLMH